jgi:glutamate-ammonia-ligase adenylyltransferase
MDPRPSPDTLLRLAPDIDPDLLGEYIPSLEEEYFQSFSADEIVEHIRRLSALSPENPVELHIRDREGIIQATIFAFDHPSIFAVITGVLAVTGFDIRSGNVFTTSPEKGPRRIIDRFSGTLGTETSLAGWEKETRSLLERLFIEIEQDEEKGLSKAKHEIDEAVAEALSETQIEPAEVFSPVEIEVIPGEKRTNMRVAAQDTPFFLYSLSNALAVHRISVERVSISTDQERAVDEFEFVDLRGEPVSDKTLLDRIRFSVLFTKQFTYFLWRAPDPYSAIMRFERILADMSENPSDMSDYMSDPKILKDLAVLLGASDFLWEDFIRSQYETLLPMLSPRVKTTYYSHTEEELPGLLEAELKKEELEKGETGKSRSGDDSAVSDPLDAKISRLNDFKDREIYLIDLDHILKPETDFLFLSRRLTTLAEITANAAVALAWEKNSGIYGIPRTVAGLTAGYALMGLGKLGGAALGYASDIELMFVYGDNGRTDGEKSITNAEFFERVFKDAVGIIRAKRKGIFRVDLRLRPHGKSGPLACSLEEFCRYYGPEGGAHSFELLALIRMRAIGGDEELGGRIERLRDEFVYATHSIDLEVLKTLREKQLNEKIMPGRVNAKFSPGALVDLEYTVQILQYMYGRDYPALQTPRIHRALEELVKAGVMTDEESAEIVEAYRFFRKLINALRMLRGNAEDLFLPPVESDEFRHLARRMGYVRTSDLPPSRLLNTDFQARTAAIRRFVEHYLGRDWVPGDVSGNAADLILSDSIRPESRAAILAEGGFRNPHRAYVNLKALAGTDRRRKRFARLAVLAWDVLAGSPDPDRALNNWERFTTVCGDPELHFEQLLSQPKRLELLLKIFSSSQFLADILIKHPDFFDWVTEPNRIKRIRNRDEIVGDLSSASVACPDGDSWRAAIRRLRKREILRIATRDICLGVPIEEIMLELSNLAEGFIEAELERNLPSPERSVFCVCAFGKLGGRELNYSSDLDLLGIYDPQDLGGESGSLREERLTETLELLRSDLSDYTDEGYVYRIDFRLRPYGSAGTLITPLPSLVEYYTRSASQWEFQALLKLRPVGGDPELGRRVTERLTSFLIKENVREEVVRSIRELRKAAIAEADRSLLSGTDIKSGRGGIRDIEFLLQGFQLIFCYRFPSILTGNTLGGLDRLADTGLLPNEIAARLKRDYAYLRRVEHFLQILEDRQTHSIPKNEEEKALLARRISPDNASGFSESLEELLTRVHETFEKYLLGLAAGDPS